MTNNRSTAAGDDWLAGELRRRLHRAQRLGIIDAATRRHIREAADVDHAEACPVHRGGQCDRCDVEISIDVPSGGPVFLLTAGGLVRAE